MKVTAIIFAMLVVYASAATQDYKLLFDSMPSFGGTGETAVDAYSKFVVFATNDENNKLFEPGMIWTAAEQPLIDFATTDDVTLADDLVTYIEGLDGGATWTATSYPALIRSPSSVEVTYTVDDQFPYVGMMVRVGTSPDFFVATQPQRIHDGTNFEEVVKAPLYGWDSGKYIENTIGAATYTEYPDEPPVPDQDTLYKPQPVVMSVTPPFAADDNVMAVGTVNFYAPTYPPQVTGVSPAEAAHGDVIRIMADNIGGANFVGTRSVTVNGVDCPIYEQDGVQTVGTFYIDCQTPSGTTLDKNVDIVVTVNGAQSQGGNAVFSYVEPDTDAGCADCYDETYGGLAPWLKYSLFAVGGLAFVAIIVVVVVVIKKKKGGSSTDERY